MEALRKTSKWKPVWERYLAIVSPDDLPDEEQIEFLDEQSKFDIEAEDDDIV